MARKVNVGLIQAATPFEESWSVEKIQHAALERHLPLIEEAGKRGVQMLGLQEIFNGPYFCPSQDPKWYAAAEPVPGPTTEKMQAVAKKHQMVMVVPVYEREQAGVYYN
ncbi:MAG TPA: nitrilase-related carbon-nitrogen hydrolase, partial [Polyangiaceae bacterium]|nr:nitrilase-related carbon-nitrogen hydrolase [Polyangiaceae bacterium]